MLSVSRQRVAQLATSSRDFPEPEVELAGGRVWARSKVEEWIARHRFAINRSPHFSCSFCGLAFDSSDLVHGPGVFICSACVGRAVAILSERSVTLVGKLPEEIERLMAPLDQSEREVMTVRFGLDRGEPRTLAEAAEVLGRTTDEVGNQEREALKKLRR